MLLPDIAIFCSILQLQGKKSWFNLDHDRVRVEIWVRLLVYKKEFWKLEIFNFQNHIWHPSHLPDVHDCNPNCTNQIHVTQVPVDLRCGRGRRRCRHVRANPSQHEKSKPSDSWWLVFVYGQFFRWVIQCWLFMWWYGHPKINVHILPMAWPPCMEPGG